MDIDVKHEGALAHGMANESVPELKDDRILEIDGLKASAANPSSASDGPLVALAGINKALEAVVEKLVSSNAGETEVTEKETDLSSTKTLANNQIDTPLNEVRPPGFSSSKDADLLRGEEAIIKAEADSGIAANGHENGTVEDRDDEDEGGAGEDEDGDGDEQSTSSDEEELPLVQNPSEDIRGDLIHALESSGEFSGTFFSSRSYNVGEAPNPLITIEDFGILGLPLSVPEAKRLIGATATKQAPFGMGERTVVDKAVRDTWEIDASKIQFRNANWDSWMAREVVPHVANCLGVNTAVTAPRAELYKLLLYETGSHFLPHQDTEKAPGMFATIVLVLPSEFSGGSLHLSHAGKTQTIDISENSFSMTHALAWYTDVYHSVQPVTSGYRLALSYNLFHTKSLRPSLQTVSAKADVVKHVLLSWKQANEGRLDIPQSVPEKLCFLLDHEYSEVNLLASALKGKDAGLVSQLAPIAKEIRFGLYIANIVLHKSGPGDDYGGYDDSDVSFAEVYERRLSIENVVDLDGMPMAESDIDIDMEDVIPEPFGEDGEPDDQEYEGYMGNGAGTLEHWYHRSVLIFCPEKDFFDVGDITNYACNTLANCESLKPSRRERKLAGKLFVSCTSGAVQGQDMKRAVASLSSAAIKWKDSELWTKAVSAYPPGLRLQDIGVDGFVQAYKVFGFALLETPLNSAVQSDESNSRRFSAIRELSKVGNDNSDDLLIKWCKAQYEIVLGTLKPASEKDVDVLVETVKQGGEPVLRETIFPQLSEKGNSAFWCSFLGKVKQEKDAIPPNPDVVQATVVNQACAIVSKAPTFPAKLVKANHYLYEKDKMEPLVEPWLRYVRLGVTLGDADTCLLYFKRMQEDYNKGDVPRKDWIADNFIPSAIIKFEVEAVTYKKEMFELCAEFFRFALDVYANRTVTQGKGNFTVSTFMIAAKRSGNAEYLKAKLNPLYSQLAQKRPAEAQQMLSTLVEEKRAMKSDHPDAAVYSAIIDGLMKSVIAAANLEAQVQNHGYTYGRYYGTTAAPESTGLKLVKLCFSVDCEAHIRHILDKILMPKPGCDVTKQIQHGLVPLIPQLKSYLESVKRSIYDEPFASFVAKAIKGYIKNVLGQKPNETVPVSQLKTVGCKRCEDCSEMRRLLLTEEKVISLARKQTIRIHLEKELAKTRPWGITWTTIRYGSPQKLQITKPDSMTAPIIWAKKQDAGLRFVESVGDQAALQKILGDSFATVAGALGMKVTGTLVPPIAQTSQAARTTAPNASVSAASSSSAGPSRQPDMSTSKKRASGVETQPKKRTKLDDDVIDLTDSPPKKK